MFISNFIAISTGLREKSFIHLEGKMGVNPMLFCSENFNPHPNFEWGIIVGKLILSKRTL